MRQNMSFDRVAHLYDETRSLPPDATRKVTALIAQVGRFTPRTCLLEIGIGTGRMAIPLLEHLPNITGVDIGMGMLHRLRTKTGAERVRLALADAADLPFGDSTFDRILISHLFHLLPEPERVNEAILRVLERGGYLLHCRTEVHPGVLAARRAADSAVNGTGSEKRRWSQAQSFLDHAGWGRHTSHTLTYTEHFTPSHFMESFRKRAWSSIWHASDDAIARGVEAMRGPLLDAFGTLDEPVEITHSFHVDVHTPPGAP